ncbi:DHA2 family efflux MFS transporter permease subunit [Kribbella ginsengisoli]|uniref:MFS transporter n=1 Tax=Kribbella ginsengisoli TaxID=363865 RepID=A0ABP6Z8X9_9ACTN
MTDETRSRARVGGSGELVALRSPAGVALVAATVLASMIGFLDAFMINVAVPAIAEDLDAGVSQLQWVLTGYLITVAALLLLAGALADHFGRRRVLVAGLLVMLVASIGCAAAGSVGTLVVARLLQGAGGALVVPSSLALLNGTLVPSDRARAIGIWAGLATLSSTFGPYGGGWLVDHASWRYVFLLNLPLIIAALLVITRVPEVTWAPRPLSLDLLGALFAIAGLGGIIYALTEGPGRGWDDPVVLVFGLVGILSLAGLVPLEQHRSTPLLRLALFKSRQFDAINAATLLFYGALAAASYLVVLQCELQLGFSATETGAALIPESVVFLLVSPFVGGLVARIGTRWPMAIGILIVAAGFGWLSTTKAGDSYVSAVLPGALLWGLGIGLAVAPLTAGVLAAVDDNDLGEASAINDAASRVGGVVMVALVPLLLGAGSAKSLAEPLASRFSTAMLVIAGLCVAAALLTIVYVSRDRTPHNRMPAPSPRVAVCLLPDPAGSPKS